MSKCCTGLTKGWWWLLMLFGLGMLYFFMLQAKQLMIENDLQTRIQRQLVSEGITGVTISLQQRGRDVLLSGTVATQQERDRVIALAERVTGVRVVDHGLQLPPPTKPTLVLSSEQNKMVLSGILPSQQHINELIQAAVVVYGTENVDNQLIFAENISSPTWINDSKLLFKVLHSVDRATLTLATGVPLLSGLVYSDAEKALLHQQVQGLLSMPIKEKIAVNSNIEPADVTAHITNDQLTLKGKLPSQAQIDDLLALMTEPFGKQKIDNQLLVSEDITPDKGRLTLLGYVDDLTHIKLSLAAKDVMASTGFTLKDHLVKKGNTTKMIIQPYTNTATPNSLLNSNYSPTQNKILANNAKALAGCQSELDQAMSGKTIHFAHNEATIETNSVALLERLVVIIRKCKTALHGSEILISGYTDNKGSAQYNTRLSQQRADAVKHYLQKAGIAQNLLKAKGFGAAQPIASNDSEVGRAKNRRITFSVANKQLVSN